MESRTAPKGVVFLSKGWWINISANISRASKQENVSTTLSAGITDVASTMDVNDASKLNFPSYLVIDRVDSAGTLKPTSLWEYVKVTNIVGSTLTITRAQGGSTQQSHSSGAVVEAVMTAALQEEYYNAFNPEHTATGGHIMGQATIAYLENSRMAVTSVASIAQLSVDNLNLKNLALTSMASIAFFNSQLLVNVSSASISMLNISTMISASGASVVGFGNSLEARARVYLSANQDNLTSGAWTKVDFNTESYDIGSNFDTGNKRFVAPVTGYYLVTVNISHINIVADKQYFAGIYVNGALYSSSIFHGSLAAQLNAIITDIVPATVGQFIEGYARNDSGANTCDIDATVSYTYMTVQLINA